jgi:hypothetical protein
MTCFSSRTSPRARRIALALLATGALAAPVASRADAAGPLVLSVGTTSAALGGASVPVTCTLLGSSGRRISAPYVTSLSVEARDALADAALGYLAGTSVPYPTGELRAGETTFSFHDVALEDVGHGARAADFRFAIHARLMSATGPLAPSAEDLVAALATSASPTPGPTGIVRATPLRPNVTRTLTISGLGVFPIAASSADADAAELRSVRIDDPVAQRLVRACIAGKRVGPVAVVSSEGRSTFASARIAKLALTFDRTGLRSSTVTFADVEKVAPSSQASAER